MIQNVTKNILYLNINNKNVKMANAGCRGHTNDFREVAQEEQLQFTNVDFNIILSWLCKWFKWF